MAAVVRKINDCVRHFCGQAEALSIWCVATCNGASVAPCVLVVWSFLYKILLLLGSFRFDKSARIYTLLFPTPLTTCSENSLYEFLSSGKTPLVNKVSCGVECCRVCNQFGVCGQSWDRPCGSHHRVDKLRWQPSYRPE